MIGQSIGHYEILDKLGEGGMGVVYLAEDTTLGRKVALKVLPEDLAKSQERKERFRREARTLAALDHPNIVSIYSVEEAEGLHFLTMQLVEGKRLSELILTGGMTQDGIFEIGIPLADALIAAHEKGVIHRDLKPGNIMVTDHGQVKVLDFGLAKLQADLIAPMNTELPTEPITEEGRIFGTIPYMSPEQLEGKEIDSRSDIFSFGVVVYEIATGERPFKGDNSASLISAVMKDTPPEVDTLRKDLPHHLSRVIRHCLEKDPRRRPQTALDVRNGLQSLSHELNLAPTLDQAGIPAAQVASGSVEVPVHTPKSRRTLWIFSALLVVAVAAMVGILMKQSSSTALGESDVLVLTDIVNSTGDPVFDGTLKQALAIKLEESPYLNLLPERQVQETLRLMGREATDKVTPEIGQEICERQGIKALVTGEIAPLGNNFVITLNAIECQTGNSLARDQIDATSKEDVLASIGTAAVNLREGLGESLATIELFDAPVEQATTSSLEALKNLNLAEDARKAGREPDSISLFQRALEIDPDFALAHARLGTVYSNLQEWDKAFYHKSRAYELRDRVSERERLYITAHYFTTVTGELSRGIDTYQQFKQTYPREWIPPNNLASDYNTIGWYHKAAEEAEQAVLLAPYHPIPYGNLARAYLNLGQIDDAKRVLEDASARDLTTSSMYTTLFDIAYLEGDQAKMDEVLETMTGDPRESEVLILQAQAAASRGKLQEAGRITNRAIDAAVTSGFKERPADYLARLARWEAAFGNFEKSAQRAASAMDIAANRDSMPIAAIAFALSGKNEEAELLIQSMSQRFPTNTYLRSVWIPLGRAALALHDADPEAMLETLEKAAPFERSNLMVLNLRGRALLMLDKPGEALAEFKKISDLSGVNPTAPVHTLAPLGVARSLAAIGDLDGARRSYEGFLEIVQDADDGLPVVVAATREFEELKKH